MEKKANILGTGGHARVVASLLLDQNAYQKIQIFELADFTKGERILGLQVIPFSKIYNNLDVLHAEDFFLAIGCNKMRKQYWEILKGNDLQTPNLISSSSFVEDSVELGEGNIICPQSYIGPCARIGDNNLLNTFSLIEHESIVGSHCHMAPKSILAGRSTLGDSCFIGLGAKIIDKLTIANGTTIGAGACLLESITEEDKTYAGIPAKDLNSVK
ncbi:MAG: acetyltransferase [Verrucomicrobiota bacterium]|nr:acetyltransferase [Verrucomicrobiota bacterium]